MRYAPPRTIIPLLLTIGLGLSACATTREQVRAELESEGGKALIKQAVQDEMKAMMKSAEHKEMMLKMMKKMRSEGHKARMKKRMMKMKENMEKKKEMMKDKDE